MASSKTPQSNKTTGKRLARQDAVRVAVAFSGGLDSTALLHSAVAAHGAENVLALHVNHGLQKNADKWLLHCARIAKAMAVDFDFRLLELGENVGISRNIEAQAREKRYQALYEMCDAHGIRNLLIGHHQDDQAETILLQLMRGSGVAGLSGMPHVRKGGATHIRIWRPFLDLTRADIEAYGQEHHLEWVEDPSNRDERFTRNAVRRKVIPLLEKIQPLIRTNLARSASHVGDAQYLLEQLADMDLIGMDQSDGLVISELMNLRNDDPIRATNALRRWLQLKELMMPSEERLEAWWRDLESASTNSDAQLAWLHDGTQLRLWRGLLTVVDGFSAGSWQFIKLDEQSQSWGLSASLYEKANAEGLFEERLREGGEKLKIHPNRPRKTLKNLFQELDIPPWQRDLPLLYLGEDLLAVAGLGMNTDLLTNVGPRYQAQWVGSSV